MKLKKLVRELNECAEDIVSDSLLGKIIKEARQRLLDQYNEIGVQEAIVADLRQIARSDVAQIRELRTLVSNRDARIKNLQASVSDRDTRNVELRLKWQDSQNQLKSVQEELAETKEQAFEDSLAKVTDPLDLDQTTSVQRPEITHKSTLSPDGDEVWITQVHHDQVVNALKQDIEKHHKRFAARTDLIDSQAERIQDVVNKRLDAEISRDKEIKAREDLQLVINQLREDYKILKDSLAFATKRLDEQNQALKLAEDEVSSKTYKIKQLVESLTRMTDERDKLREVNAEKEIALDLSCQSVKDQKAALKLVRESRSGLHVQLHNLQATHATLYNRYDEECDNNRSLTKSLKGVVIERDKLLNDKRLLRDTNTILANDFCIGVADEKLKKGEAVVIEKGRVRKAITNKSIGDLVKDLPPLKFANNSDPRPMIMVAQHFSITRTSIEHIASHNSLIPEQGEMTIVRPSEPDPKTSVTLGFFLDDKGCYRKISWQTFAEIQSNERRVASDDRRNPFRDDRRFNEENETLNTISQQNMDKLNNQLANQSNDIGRVERRTGPTDRRTRINPLGDTAPLRRTGPTDRRSEDSGWKSSRTGPKDRRHSTGRRHVNLGLEYRKNSCSSFVDQCPNCFGEGCESCSS